jgi:signal transduction histidine kinase/CheY-like chemotaxis protein
MQVIELNRQMRKWFPTVQPGYETICYRVFCDPPGDGICEYCPTYKTLQDGNVHESTTEKRFSGSTRKIRIVSSPIMNAKGEVTAAIDMVEDITDRLNLENRLKQSQKLESIGTLAGGIAHDFNNILSCIIGFTELALDDAKKGSFIADNLLEILSAGKRAKDLVGHILAFARQSEEKLEPIRADKIIGEVLHFMRSSIPTTIKIKKTIDSQSLIMGNRTQLHQIVMNLCTNAAQAMENKGGVLEVSLKDIEVDGDIDGRLDLNPGHYIEINITDTGTGIPPQIIDSIFEPYFTTKELDEGTGMGLAVVHGIVESYSGKIAVKSDQEKGTTFTIYLPITQKPKVQKQIEQGKLPTGTEHILLVDDEIPIVKMGGKLFERLGYAVTSRTNSIEALELFRSKPDQFDLVFTDMTMPNMTGDKLALELMKVRPDIPVILFTGYSKQVSEKAALMMGIKALAYKPLVKWDIAKTVRKVLDEARSA